MSEVIRLREAICRHARSLFERGLSPGSSGNISVRLDDGGRLATPTGSAFGDLRPEAIAHLGPDGRLIDGAPPTKEMVLHEAFYGTRPDAGAIVHLHSPAAVTVSVRADVDETSVLPPLTPYFVMRVGRVPLVGYHRPGDPAIGGPVADLARRHRAVLIANHGPVVSGASLAAAVDAAEELEATARLFLDLGDRPARLLTETEIADLVRTFGASW